MNLLRANEITTLLKEREEQLEWWTNQWFREIPGAYNRVIRLKRETQELRDTMTRENLV